MAHHARAYTGFGSMKQLGVFPLPPEMLVHRIVATSLKFTGSHLYIWVERGIVRVKRLTQEHNITPLARARTRTARSGDEHTNHEATTPSHKIHSWDV